MTDTLYTKQILRLLPHRAPFLLIDRVESLVENESVVAYKNISYNEPWVAGHFPNMPIFPGVLALEAMAQTCAVLGCASLKLSSDNLEVFLVGIDKVRFRRAIVPGDKLVIHAKQIRDRLKFHTFSSECYVDEELAAAAQIMCTFSVPSDESVS